MAELTPPDLNQCQAEKPNGHSFMTLGGGHKMVRCKNTPTVIATERDVGPDGEHGSMSLCEQCRDVMIEQLGCGFAEFKAIPPPPPLYDVSVYDGKYRYVQHSDGRCEVFRNGERWNRDVVGDKFVLALVQEIDTLTVRNAKLKDGIKKARAEWLEHEGLLTSTDVVTPYDEYLY